MAASALNTLIENSPVSQFTLFHADVRMPILLADVQKFLATDLGRDCVARSAYGWLLIVAETGASPDVVRRCMWEDAIWRILHVASEQDARIKEDPWWGALALVRETMARPSWLNECPVRSKTCSTPYPGPVRDLFNKLANFTGGLERDAPVGAFVDEWVEALLAVADGVDGKDIKWCVERIRGTALAASEDKSIRADTRAFLARF